MRFHYTLAWLFINLVLHLFKILKKTGIENIPKSGGVIIASNHIAYFDPPILGGCAPREIHYLAKWELFKNKIISLILKAYNAIPIKRKTFDRQALSKSLDLLKSGKALLLFPEGARSRNGEFLLPKLGVGKLALEAGVAIVPTYIANSQNPFKAFLGGEKIIVKFGPPIQSNWLEKIPKDKKGYQLVVDEIMQRIKKLKN